jgi:hypothetical protein
MSTAGSFDELHAQYKRQIDEYNKTMESSILRKDPTRLPELRTKSEEIQNTLNRMIENITYLKKETPDIRSERDALLEKLRRIQRDYSEMVANTDDLETLRRIREQEGGEARRLLLLYLMAFLFVSVLLLVYLVYSGRERDTSQTTVATPTISPPLT